MENSQRKVYRVYNPFYYVDESGTNEYGYYSSLDKAKARLREVLKDVKGIKWESETFASVVDPWDNGSYYIETIVLDNDLKEKNIG